MKSVANPMDLSGRTVLVTGASSGIGRDTCVLLSELGASVVLVARNEDRLRETLARMAPGNHLIRPYDVTEFQSTSDWMAEISRETGPIHGMVHSAGMAHTEALKLLDWDKYHQIMDLNLRSVFALVKAYRQRMVRARPTASVVLISSVAAIRGYPGHSIYSATKGAIVSAARTLAVELARESVRVNCVLPGLVVTEMAATVKIVEGAWQKTVDKHLYGLGSPRDISHSIAFLIGDTARWITGESLVIDGGLTIH